MTNKQDKHGTIQRYENGCRCLFCCTAWLDYQREISLLRLKKVSEPKKK
jgi:hypothetical protein